MTFGTLLQPRLFSFNERTLAESCHNLRALRADVTGNRTRMNEQRWAAAQSQSAGKEHCEEHYDTVGRISLTLRTDLWGFFFENIDELIDWLLRWLIDLNLHPSVCWSTMARGEGAEQCAATLLAVKPLNADIKTAKVRNSHFLSTAVRVCAPNCKAAPHLEV